MPNGYEDVAEQIVQSCHPGGEIVATGHVVDFGDEPIASGHTLVLDTRGQGQDLRVYEVIFHKDGTGVYLQAAGSYSQGSQMPEDFKWDLVCGQVILRSDIPEKDVVATRIHLVGLRSKKK